MLSCCAYNFLFQSLIIFIFYFIEILSRNHSYHQVLKADVGQDITMSCIFDQEKIEQVSFMRQMTGDILSVGSELFVHQSHIQLQRFASNRLDLKIISVNENDSGIYTCMFNDEKLISFLIEIFVPPRFLSYFPLEGSISYSEYSTMNLSCHAFAIPPVNITWIYINKDKQSKNIYNGENLYSPSIHSSASGLYECIASNMYHASISRAFYVTIQYSPRVLILNEKIRTALHDTVLVKCQVCSIPVVEQISWWRDDQQILDENIHLKIHVVDEQCSESIMRIVDINKYQFGQYECRGENNLGRKSHFMRIQQITRSRKLSSEEINRNGRTALLINKSQKKRKNQLTTTTTESSNEIYLSNSIRNQFSRWWLLSLSICWILQV